jgi:hypothetical protein
MYFYQKFQTIGIFYNWRSKVFQRQCRFVAPLVAYIFDFFLSQTNKIKMFREPLGNFWNF